MVIDDGNRAETPDAAAIDALERAFQAGPPAPVGRGTVRLICQRIGDGRHLSPERVAVTVEGGVDGDRWTSSAKRDPEAQVTLMSARVARLVAAAAGQSSLAEAGDNFLVELALDEASLPAGTRLRLGTALLEVSAKPHTGCKKFRERFGLAALTWINAHRERRLRGVNCRVIESGQVAVGDRVEIVPA